MIAMKILRPALIAAILCCFAAGAAFANSVRVVFDPPSAPIPISDLGGLGAILDPTAVYSVPTESCNSLGPQQAFNPAADDTGDTCIALLNLTNTSLSQFDVSFVLTQAIVTNDDPTSVACLTTPTDTQLLSFSCDPNGTLNVGDTVSAQFFAANSTQDVPPNTAIFVEIQGIALADLSNVNVTAPEPTSLTLLAAGMGLIGLCMAFSKR